ncbi:MAG: glycosyltransferase family 2 protein [Candidatus Omnitrophota bacterium]|nr:MAG: glycosyltransferase family 2 protein [Candidatus Omnitrophota bacterium]
MNVWVVIPAYNEAGSLEGIIQELKKRNLFVLVIDDGSGDTTFKVAQKAADRVIQNTHNLGKGRSLKEAIAQLLQKSDFDYIITMDGDGQHSPFDVDNFLKEATRGQYFVVGNRMQNPVGMPRLRVFTNQLMSWFISKMIGQKIPDTQCGFRLIKRDVLENIKITTSKFEIESEILLQAAKRGFAITSIPIQSIYFQGVHSNINPFIDTLRFIRFIFQLKSG